MLQVAKILGSVLASILLFSNFGAVRSIYQEIVKFSAQRNIAMLKSMMRTLARQNGQVYQDAVKILREHFTEEEIQGILSHEQ